MNIQTDPSLLKGVIEPLPASADQPIRSTFFHEANMRKLGEELAQSRPAVPGLRRIRIPAPHPRERRQDPRGLSRHQRRAGEGRGDHARRAVAARQPLPDRRDGLPGQARPAAPLLQGASGRFVRRRPADAARAGHRLGLCRAFRQLGLGLDVRGDRRRLPVGRAAQDRRIVGAALAAALRADREPAPAGAARQPHPRAAQRRQHAGRPDRRRGRWRRPGQRSWPATPRMRATPPSRRSSCTGCATARAMPGGRWSGSRTSSNATAPTPRR